MSDHTFTKLKQKILLATATTVLCVVAIDDAYAASEQGEANSLKSRVTALEAQNADLSAQLDSLQAFVKKLHRNSAAVIDIDTGGGSSIQYDSIEVVLDFCTEAEAASQTFGCPESLRDLSVSLTNADSGQAFTFTADNDPDFDSIVSLLTDGNPDLIVFSRKIGQGGGASSAPEPIYFKNVLPSDGVDLQGFEIESITLLVDYFLIFDGNNLREYILRGRLYYEFGE